MNVFFHYSLTVEFVLSKFDNLFNRWIVVFTLDSQMFRDLWP